MKKRPAPTLPAFRVFRLATLLGLAGALPFNAHATTYAWTGGGGNGNWNTAANWNGNVPPTSDPNTALIFAGGTQLHTVENISGGFNLNSLTFDATALAFTLSGAQGTETLNFRRTVGNLN